MSEASKDILKNISMIDKVAQFCVLIGEEATVKIFQNLPTETVEQISTAITSIASIDKETSLAILDEFHLYTKSKSFISSGGFEYAKDILYKSLGKTEADAVLGKLSRMKQAKQSFAYLEAINPQQLSDFIKDESPQTIAVVLSHMESGAAADVLNALEEDLRVKVTMQIATIKDIQPDVVRTMSKVLEKKLESLLSSVTEVGGIKVVADMLNKMGPKSQDILSNINGIDTTLATNIKENMFVFEDLINLGTDNIMKVLSNVELADVAVALSRSDQDDIDLITDAMSQRATDRFKEEFELLGKIKIKDLEAAQRKMLDAAQKLIDEGTIDRSMEEEE
ncbi:MAG: flagellar motor switch protein FliG [Arcobacteraceae bacterium]|nr:flagellar motor switch protein FliG [Arcobacteraceae bacterium]